MKTELPLSDIIMQILVALGEGPLHGYAIMKRIETDTDGQVKVHAPTLYRNIHNMVKQDFIEEVGLVMPVDVRRRYYQLTEHGTKMGKAQLEYTLSLARIAQERLIK